MSIIDHELQRANKLLTSIIPLSTPPLTFDLPQIAADVHHAISPNARDTLHSSDFGMQKYLIICSQNVVLVVTEEYNLTWMADRASVQDCDLEGK
jgi:hypothetical protein